MKVAAGMLRQWHRENPARLLQAALLQAERLAQMAPELEALRAQNASLHQELEVKTKRIAQLEEALQAAERAAHRQAAPFRVEPQKRSVAPKRPGRKPGHSGTCRHKPDDIDEHLEGPRRWLRLHEKGGKEHEMPAHHQIEETVDEYLSKVSIDDKQPLFQSVNKAGTALSGRGAESAQCLDSHSQTSAQRGISDPGRVSHLARDLCDGLPGEWRLARACPADGCA